MTYFFCLLGCQLSDIYRNTCLYRELEQTLFKEKIFEPGSPAGLFLSNIAYTFFELPEM